MMIFRRMIYYVDNAMLTILHSRVAMRLDAQTFPTRDDLENQKQKNQKQVSARSLWLCRERQKASGRQE